MSRALRVILALAAAIAAYSLMSVATLLLLPSGAPALFTILAAVLSLVVAFLAGRLVWRGPQSQAGAPGAGRSVAMGALLFGGIGFFGGFVGPMILAPHANQGPMLGIFITGPLGVILGAIAGFIRYRSRARREEA